MTENGLTDEQLEQLLDVGRSLVTELDLEALLGRVVDAARDLTGARYAALGILDEQKTGLERFLHSGIDEQTRRAIGPLPRGRGVLGELIRNPSPLRLADVSSHPRSYGFPPSHPEMNSFLGTPILIRGEAWGNLYLTEKEGGAEFDEDDEQLVIVLAAWAAVAIDNARLYEGMDRRRSEVERALRGLEASSDISRTATAGIELGDLLELIAKRGRDIVGAGTAMVLMSDGEELEVVAAAGEHPGSLFGLKVPDGPAWLRDLCGEAPELGGLDSVCEDLEFRGRPRGLLVALDSRDEAGFGADDERVFESFAASAATTIATVRAVEAEKLELSIQASERERRRWARELHDETLQELGALRFVLESAGKGGTDFPAEMREAAIDHVDRGIRNLQGLITELRPSVLDDLGIKPAIEALARQTEERFQLQTAVEVAVDLGEGEGERLDPELEATIYRLVQEAVNNAVKHASAKSIAITLTNSGGSVTVVVRDDGSGFDPHAVESSFGLIGMQERVALARGTLEVDSSPGAGTTVRAELPLARAQAGDGAVRASERSSSGSG